MCRPDTTPYNTVDFINMAHSGHTELLRQHKIKSSTRENDATERLSKHGTYEAAACRTQHTVLQQTFFMSRKSTSENKDEKYSRVTT